VIPRGPRRGLPVLLTRAAALALIALGLGSDLLEIGRPGFGERQALALIVGSGLLIASFLGLGGRSAEGSRGQRLRAGYSTLAVLLLNTALALLLVNLLLAAGFRVGEAAGGFQAGPGLDSPLLRVPVVRLVARIGERLQRQRIPTLALPDEHLAKIYPGWSRPEIEELLVETRSRSLRFDPFTQFQEQPFQGRYVNVVEPGFRLSGGPAPWPMEPHVHNVWVLGGSTTFGYGLPDGETVPAFLQQALRSHYPGVPIRVYNFGQGYFYSSQELALFQRLLAEGGPVPRVAVFLDGINEHQRVPFYSGYLGDLVRSPLAALFRRPADESFARGEDTAERWLRNRRMIQGVCASFAIKPLFVWQPAPDWGYDLRFHPLWREEGPAQAGPEGPLFGSSIQYAAMDHLRSQRPDLFKPDVLWLADLQRGERRPLYVDRLHYTAEFSRVIAERIADHIWRGL
jgi:hypothetical protein